MLEIASGYGHKNVNKTSQHCGRKGVWTQVRVWYKLHWHSWNVSSIFVGTFSWDTFTFQRLLRQKQDKQISSEFFFFDRQEERVIWMILVWGYINWTFTFQLLDEIWLPRGPPRCVCGKESWFGCCLNVLGVFCIILWFCSLKVVVLVIVHIKSSYPMSSCTKLFKALKKTSCLISFFGMGVFAGFKLSTFQKRRSTTVQPLKICWLVQVVQIRGSQGCSPTQLVPARLHVRQKRCAFFGPKMGIHWDDDSTEFFFFLVGLGRNGWEKTIFCWLGDD